MTYLTVGDPVPWFTLPSTSSANFHFNSVGGYRIVLFFFGSSKNTQMSELLKQFSARQHDFASYQVPFFGVSIDPDDLPLGEFIENKSFFKFLWDFERQVSIKYGVCQQPQQPAGALPYQPTIFILDETLRVIEVFSTLNIPDPVERVFAFLNNLPPIPAPAPAARQAPVLFIPNVLDKSFCQHLIDLYETNGGQESGFMREIDGKTVGVYDYGFKKRRDYFISEQKLLEKINQFIIRRVKPEIEKAFQFSITRFERYLIACYEAEQGGFFNRHRDNTSKGTAHRRFAMSLNLNTEDYEGGYLRFPEYGSQLYRPNTGEAVIFSCSLLHEATPVISGRRFALLSFFYNDEDARIRAQNQAYVVSPEAQS